MKILIPVEDPLFADAIVDFVVTHNSPAGTRFKVLHVVEPLLLEAYIGMQYYELTPTLVEESHANGMALVYDVASRIRNCLPGLKVEEELVDGSPKGHILSCLSDWKADAVVLGSHGRSGIGKFFLGGVSSAVLPHANCSLFIIRPLRTNAKVLDGSFYKRSKPAM